MRRERYRRRAAGILFVLAVIAVVFAAAALKNLRSVAVELAIADATDIITITVNDVVQQAMRSGGMDYSDLVTLEKDRDGNITALITNMSKINTVQAEMSNAVVQRFGESDLTEIGIPLGNLFGTAILSGRGPRVKIRMLSVTNVSTEFRHEFSSAGINQTRHQILMDIHVGLGVLFAGRKETDDVTVTVNIAETVIIGGVPNTYADLGI